MRQSGTLLLLSHPPRATSIIICERETGTSKEISIPSRLGHPLQVSLFCFNLQKEYGTIAFLYWKLRQIKWVWVKILWKFAFQCEGISPPSGPSSPVSFSQQFFAQHCAHFKIFFVSIRVCLERQRCGTDTTSEMEWIHWDSDWAQHSSPGSDNATLHQPRTGSNLTGQSFPGLGGREEGMWF